MVFVRKVKVGKYTYLREVKSVWIDGKCKQKYIRTIGKVIDGKKILNNSQNIEVNKVTIHGPLLALNCIANEIGLGQLLGNYSQEILSIVYSHCIDPKSINKMVDWFAKTDLNNLLNLENLTERRLSDALNDINDERRISYFQQKIFSVVQKKYQQNQDCFFYDITNVYFFGSECKIAKRGKSKEGGFKRIVQIGLAVMDSGIPIFHQTFAGNIADSRTMFTILESIKEYGMQNPFLIFDRGVTSKTNVFDAKKLGFEVICGIKLTSSIKNIIDKRQQKNKIVDVKNRIQLQNCAFYVEKLKHKLGKTGGYLYFCLDLKKRIDLKEKRLKGIYGAQEIVKEGKQPKERYGQYLTKKGKIKRNIIIDLEKYDGYSIIFCTKKMSNKEVVQKYFEKDVVEKAFACLKGVVKIRPIRKWLTGRVKAHIFICFISYLLLSILQYKLKRGKLRFSAIEALEQLETMYKVHFLDKKSHKKFTKTVNFTRNQEDILRIIDKKLLESND